MIEWCKSSPLDPSICPAQRRSTIYARFPPPNSFTSFKFHGTSLLGRQKMYLLCSAPKGNSRDLTPEVSRSQGCWDNPSVRPLLCKTSVRLSQYPSNRVVCASISESLAITILSISSLLRYDSSTESRNKIGAMCFRVFSQEVDCIVGVHKAERLR